MANILVIGSLKHGEESRKDDLLEFVRCLGKKIVQRGHCLYTGCMNDLDELVARSAHDWLIAEKLDPDNCLINYYVAGTTPKHRYGRIRESFLKDWRGGQERIRVPEQVKQADVVVLVGGGTGTRLAADWARLIDKLILPVAAIKGTAKEVYLEELQVFDSKYGRRRDLRGQYENLTELPSEKLAGTIVDLAERLTSSRDVFVIMSFSDNPDLEDALTTFVEVCDKIDYQCSPLNELNAEERILPEIKDRIEKAAFVIADLTEAKPNVYYELGYADALGKRLIVTAYKDEEKPLDLPFDVKDIPVLLWKNQTELKKKLRKKIEQVTSLRDR